MNRPSEELLHKTLENRATAAEAASVAEWLATDSGQAWASRYIGRDFDRQESCGDYENRRRSIRNAFLHGSNPHSHADADAAFFSALLLS